MSVQPWESDQWPLAWDPPRTPEVVGPTPPSPASLGDLGTHSSVFSSCLWAMTRPWSQAEMPTTFHCRVRCSGHCGKGTQAAFRADGESSFPGPGTWGASHSPWRVPPCPAVVGWSSSSSCMKGDRRVQVGPTVRLVRPSWDATPKRPGARTVLARGLLPARCDSSPLGQTPGKENRACGAAPWETSSGFSRPDAPPLPNPSPPRASVFTCEAPQMLSP